MQSLDVPFFLVWKYINKGVWSHTLPGSVQPVIKFLFESGVLNLVLWPFPGSNQALEDL